MKNQILFTALIALTLILFPSPLKAQDDTACRSPQTQSAMNQCAGLDYRRADVELNRVYRQLVAALRRDRREQLTTAQLAWISFRDEHCDFVSSRYAGGSIQPLIQNDCLAEVTRTRIEQLKVLLAQASE
jgi:uncharacterized protein YecT (DUF1311 family)